MTDLDAEEIIELLKLEPLPSEGGLWTQTWQDDAGSAIYFLLRPNDFSALHRLPTVELWHHYGGAAAEMLLLSERRGVRRVALGFDLRNGQRPMVPVPAGTWMGARTTGAWSLLGTTMAPPFHWDGFELGQRDGLIERFPGAAEEIRALTRPSDQSESGTR